MKINQGNSAKENKISLKQKLVFALLVLSMIPLFFVTRSVITVFSQTTNKEKKIKQLFFGNEPVEIVEVGNSQKLLKLGEEFTQATDWLKDLSLEFENKSSKSIVYFEVGLDFPETKTSGNKMSFPLSYGVNPLSKIKNDKERPIKSGESLKLILTPEKYDALKSFIQMRHLVDSLNKVDIRISFIVFDDGTAWSGGSFLRPDPNDQNKFIPNDLNS